MGSLQDIASAEFFIFASYHATRALYVLVKARRTRSVPAAAVSSLCLALALFLDGVIVVGSVQRSPLIVAGAIGLSTLALLVLVVPGVISRRRTGVPWWRFWVNVIPLAAEGFEGLGAASHPDANTNAAARSGQPDRAALDLIEKIDSARFGTTRLSTGYDEAQVDDFLDTLIAVLRGGGRLNRAYLVAARFSTTRIRPGYLIQDVDTFLDEIVQTGTEAG